MEFYVLQPVFKRLSKSFRYRSLIDQQLVFLWNSRSLIDESDKASLAGLCSTPALEVYNTFG